MPRITKADALADLSPDVARTAKKAANNTWTYSRDGATVIRLHRTDIVTRRADGSIMLESGGYHSLITKERMNREVRPLGYSVYSDKGLWVVRRIADDVKIPYYDGMIIPAAFEGKGLKAAERAGADAAALQKAILKYCGKIRKLPELPRPSSGDCWCCMADPEPVVEDKRGGMGHARDNGQSGRAANVAHLREHIREGYIHGTLLVNAMRWAGYKDSGIAYYFNSKDKWCRQTVSNAVRRYLRRKLAIG